MPWFVAHAITYCRWKDLPQDKFNVEEDCILIEAADHVGAWRAAEGVAGESAGDDLGSFTEYGHPAERVFVGLRKVHKIPEYLDFTRPGHGDEVTYSTYALQDLASVEALAAGEQVELRYVETQASSLREDFEEDSADRNL